MVFKLSNPFVLNNRVSTYPVFRSVFRSIQRVLECSDFSYPTSTNSRVNFELQVKVRRTNNPLKSRSVHILTPGVEDSGEW